MILDSTCSAKRIWPAHADVRIDINPATHPDVIADASRAPFKSRTFDEVYCDPPHLIGNAHYQACTFRNVGSDYARFKCWNTRQEYWDFLTGINVEFARILKAGGLLYYKTTEGLHGHAIKLTELSRLTNFEIIEDEKVVSKGALAMAMHVKWGSTSYTHYVTLRLKE